MKLTARKNVVEKQETQTPDVDRLTSAIFFLTLFFKTLLSPMEFPEERSFAIFTTRDKTET